MAYGRSRGFGTGAGTGAGVRTRYGKRPVTARSAYRKIWRKPVKRTVAKNVAKIARLNRIVNMGKLQRNFQTALVSPGVNYEFKPSNPICFMANDFTDFFSTNTTGGQIFGAAYTGSAGAYDCSAVVVKNWHLTSHAIVQGLKPEYDQWADNNDDRASSVGYLPVSARYTISVFFGVLPAAQEDYYVRVDLIKTKRYYINSDYNKFTMPSCVGALSNTALAASSGQRNAYNPSLFSVKTKYIRVKAQPVDRTNVYASLVFSIKFKSKLLSCNLAPISASAYEPMWAMVDPKDAIWCVLNSSQTSLTAPRIEMSRQIVFRDSKGTQA